MGVDSDLIKLYSGRILALAGNIPFAERLETPMATARKRSPLCGSTVTVDIDVEHGEITRFGQDVKACALGQASASVLAGVVIGRTQSEISQATQELKQILAGDDVTPTAPFGDLSVLTPAQDFPNRHASILLAFEATLDALDKAHHMA